MELSRSKWLITSLSPGSGERMSKHVMTAGDVSGLLDRLDAIKSKQRREPVGRSRSCRSRRRGSTDFGSTAFSTAKALRATWSIQLRSRHRGGDAGQRPIGSMVRRCCGCCLHTSAATPGVCSMVVVPTPDEEDRRRNSRERKALVQERVSLVIRLKGLLFSQGISDYEPLKADRRERFAELVTGDGRAIGEHLRAAADRILDRIS